MLKKKFNGSRAENKGILLENGELGWSPRTKITSRDVMNPAESTRAAKPPSSSGSHYKGLGLPSSALTQLSKRTHVSTFQNRNRSKREKNKGLEEGEGSQAPAKAQSQLSCTPSLLLSQGIPPPASLVAGKGSGRLISSAALVPDVQLGGGLPSGAHLSLEASGLREPTGRGLSPPQEVAAQNTP